MPDENESAASKDDSFDEEKGNFTIFDEAGLQVEDVMDQYGQKSESSSDASDSEESSSEEDM